MSLHAKPCFLMYPVASDELENLTSHPSLTSLRLTAIILDA
jgi:hypothetical protein